MIFYKMVEKRFSPRPAVEVMRFIPLLHSFLIHFTLRESLLLDSVTPNNSDHSVWNFLPHPKWAEENLTVALATGVVNHARYGIVAMVTSRRQIPSCRLLAGFEPSRTI